MAVSAYALTSLGSLKTWLGISVSTYDAVLESSIDRATSLIESFCDRRLVARTHYEWAIPRGERTFQVKHAPIVAINTVAFGHRLGLTVTSDSASTDVLATVGFDGTEVRLRKIDSSGTASTATISVATYPTTSAIVDYVNGSVAGWSATLSTNAYARSLYRFGGRGVIDAPCLIEYPGDNVSAYEIEQDLGLIHIVADRFPGIREDDATANRFPRGFFPVFVEYEGGLETIPDDLEQACIEIAADLYRERLVDTTVVSESLGDYNYTRTSPADLLQKRSRLLEAYREIR